MDDRSRRVWIIVALLLTGAGVARGQNPPTPEPNALVVRDPPLPPPPARYFAPPDGWFAGAEFDLIAPRFATLRTTRAASDITFLGAVRSLDLDTAGAGELDLGYRWEDGNGLMLSSRGSGSTAHVVRGGQPGYGLAPTAFTRAFFDQAGAQGDGAVYGFGDGTRDLHAHVTAGRLDFDYLSAPAFLGDSFRLGWSGGLRVVGQSAELRADDSFTITRTDSANGSQAALPVTTHQRVTNSFGGLGAHLALDGSWALGESGFALLGKVDGGLVGGGARQRASFSMSGPVSEPGATSEVRPSAVVTTLNARAGVSYTVLLSRAWVRLSAGYQFEEWWFDAVGKPAEQEALFKRLDWLDHGAFLRGEIGF
jgi:hypothetical protein